MSEVEDPAVSRFREYLRIDAVHPNINYDGCIAWVQKQAEEIGLKFSIKEFDGREAFAVWLTWEGRDPSLKAILLNSHMDVVPVDLTKWNYPPFAAEKDAEGNIYARGSQDMKSVGAQYLEAIRVLKAKGFVPRRTVHISFVPDEEVGSNKGMRLFSKSEEFKNLNIGFGLDEGVAHPGDGFKMFYGEKVMLYVKFTAKGQTGHGSLLHENTAAEKIHVVINKLLGLRAVELQKYRHEGFELGDVTSINLTMISGGLQPNVVPPELSVVFDIRLTPTLDLAEFEKTLDDLCVEAGSEVSYEFLFKGELAEVTKLDDTNRWWTTFKGVIGTLGYELLPEICAGATDARWLRLEGIPCLGFSPMNNTPILLHGHNEFLNENVFLKGITIYEQLLVSLSSIEKD